MADAPNHHAAQVGGAVAEGCANAGGEGVVVVVAPRAGLNQGVQGETEEKAVGNQQLRCHMQLLPAGRDARFDCKFPAAGY